MRHTISVLPSITQQQFRRVSLFLAHISQSSLQVLVANFLLNHFVDELIDNCWLGYMLIVEPSLHEDLG